MKQLFCKTLAIIALMMSVIVPSQAFDSFSYTVLNLPDDPRIDEPWFKVIRNQEDWESFFYARTAAVTFLESMAPIAPDFDFEEYQIITGGLGLRSSGGFYLSIESVVQNEEELLIHVLDVRPAPSCVVSFAITHPSVTLLVKKTDRPIKFFVTELTQQCAEK